MKKPQARRPRRSGKAEVAGLHWVQVVGTRRSRVCQQCEAILGHYYPLHHAPHVPPTGCRCSLTVVISVHEDDVPEWARL